ncbi:MAG: signal recognition particle protein, partial [Oscillospiraceae bacterium]|nr:signal recognition particle protein [Oscillospiraceae bacterium]
MAFETLSEKLSASFKKLRGKGRLSEADIKEAMREVRMALLEADVSYKVVKDFVKSVSERCSGAEVMESLSPSQMVIKIVNEELTALMGGSNTKLNISSKSPSVVMLVGLQGAGKTTNGAKLAALMKKQQNKRPLLVACDIYRPAAIKQLQTVGEQLGLPVFEMGTAKPVDIAKAAISHAKKHGNDLVFLDTAGRLHIDETLMDELKEIKAEVEPAEILLVVDAMTGQDAVNAAAAFDEALGIDGIMLTQLDGDARGGAALSIKAVTGKPIKFAGTGEKLDAIEAFHPDRMASRILGMGDILSFIEKAEQTLDKKKSLELVEKVKKNRLTLMDYYDQISQIKSMGGVQDLAGMIPGMDAKALQGASIDEKALARTEAIILSMTPKERENPSILNSSRKK